VLLHDAQKFNDDLGRRSDENLSLALSLGIDDSVEGVVKNADSDHIDVKTRIYVLSDWTGTEGQC
jgi:hypothetical protein